MQRPIMNTLWRGFATVVVTAGLVAVGPLPASAGPASELAAATTTATIKPASTPGGAVGGGFKTTLSRQTNLACIPGECGPPPEPSSGGCTADVGWRRDGSTVGRNGTLVFWGDIICTFLVNVQGQSILPYGQVMGYDVTSVAGNQLNQNVGFWHVKSQGSLPVAQLTHPEQIVEFSFSLTGPSGWTWNYAKPTTDSGAIQTCAPFGQRTIWCTVRSSPQHMRPYWYVALGDSYSAGTGTTGSEAAPCQRTAAAYPAIYRMLLPIYAPQDVEFTFVACHGATTETMYTQQLTQVAAASLGGYPDLITVTIGGNDLIARDSDNNQVGFRGILMDCIFRLLSSCSPSLDVNAATIRLDFAYQSIRQRSGYNTIVQVLQYPQILPFTSAGTVAGCPGLGRLDDTEILRIRALWHQADQLIVNRSLAANAGLTYIMFDPVQTENVLDGHFLCSSDPWAVDLGALSAWNETAFHPNSGGHFEQALVLADTW